MLYFDDFMEAIESLPFDLREELTTIRHLDNQAHNTMSPLSLRISAFFDSCKSSRLSEKEKEIEYEQILREFARAADYSKKKVAIMRSIYTTYQKVMKKLDSELEKFRLELEADNSGVTSKIEHRVRTLLGRNMPGANRLEKRRAKFRNGHLFNTNRAITKRRIPFSLEMPEKQFYVLKRRFAAFDTPMNLPPPSPYNGNGASFMAEEASNPLISESNNRLLSSDVRRIPSAGSLNSMDHNIPDHDFGTFQADPHDYCEDDEDDLQVSFDPTKRSRTLDNPQRPTGISMDHHRLHHGGSSCYSPLVNTSDTEAVTLATGGSAVATDPSIDELLTHPTSSASPSLKCGESPRWIGGLAATVDKTRRVGVHSRRPSQMSSSTIDTNDDTGDYVSSSELHHLSHSHRYALGQPPAGPLKDQQQQQRQQQDSHTSTAAGTAVDESKYCFCKDVSYGDMIACDAPNCPIEWFHYPCVNLTVAPKGRWYCPICTANGAAGTRFAGISSTSRKRVSRR